MIQLINNLPDNVVGFEVTGEVTKEQYEATIVPRMDELAKRQGEINYLIVIKTDLTAFTPGVWFDDFKMALKHFSKWDKIAIVSDQDAIQKLTSIFGFAFPGDSKDFSLSEYDEAVSWVS
ncbi:SpoIIAA family protein [Mucilaginibacter segetis]|uniref:STAS/SEC14 domain-containing protein n=1 Tax=Mucilaginibacter segetis TaxID=2793071 RepID=A0A934PP14_9SPHI|nr:STAS/SEC14 domain-containing protein [Mucilaginibacter segetis]MBK0378094.1 STAS/SEC14 domain-containing protein [Mucilaginibacter segetis]